MFIFWYKLYVVSFASGIEVGMGTGETEAKREESVGTVTKTSAGFTVDGSAVFIGVSMPAERSVKIC